jgi:hypothetical protein
MKFLESPLRVLIFSLVLAFVSLIFNGTFLQLYRLHRDGETLTQQIIDAKKQIAEMDRTLKMAKDPSFFEKQALDNLDFATEDDLIFVFSDEDPT